MILILSLVLFIGAHDHHNMPFKNAEKWVKNFEHPSRDEWQKPQDVINALEISDNEVIGDLGAGTGYFSARIAKQFPKATVFAIDNEKDMTDYLQKRANQEKLSNLKPVLSLSDSFLVDKPLDILLIVDTYHHLPDRKKYFQKIMSQLKSDARIVVVDFLPTSPVGPPKKYRFQPPQIEEELKEFKFKREKLFNLPRQFVLILKR